MAVHAGDRSHRHSVRIQVGLFAAVVRELELRQSLVDFEPALVAARAEDGASEHVKDPDDAPLVAVKVVRLQVTHLRRLLKFMDE